MVEPVAEQVAPAYLTILASFFGAERRVRISPELLRRSKARFVLCLRMTETLETMASRMAADIGATPEDRPEVALAFVCVAALSALAHEDADPVRRARCRAGCVEQIRWTPPEAVVGAVRLLSGACLDDISGAIRALAVAAGESNPDRDKLAALVKARAKDAVGQGVLAFAILNLAARAAEGSGSA